MNVLHEPPGWHAAPPPPGGQASLSPANIRQLSSILDHRERTLRGLLSAAIRERVSGDQVDPAAAGGGSACVQADAQESMDAGAMEAESRELADIALARQAMAEGRYGRCVTCGGPIALARLLAVPTARRCLGCQREAEQATWHPRIPSM